MKDLYIALVALCFTISHEDLHAQWTQSTTMEGGSIITDIVEYKNSIYIAVHNSGVYRSNDNGVSWTRTSVPPQPNYSNFAVIDDKLLVLSYGKTFRSDNGSTFAETDGIDAFVSDVATDGVTLVAAGHQGIYISGNLGLSWSRAADARTQTDIGAVAVRGTVILASASSKAGAIFKSTDSGATWAEINTGAHAVTQLAYQGSTVFMHMSETGVLRSNDDGTTWQQVRSDIVGWRFSVTPTHIYCVGRGTYAVSSNQGNTWTETLDGPPSGLSIQSLFAGASYVFAGTWGGGTYRKPLDNSVPWVSCNSGLSFHNVLDIDIKDDTILAGTEWAFVWKSSDEAQHWTRRTDYLASANGHAIVRMENDIFVAAGLIYRSRDEGQTWQDKTSNLGQAYANTLAAFGDKLYTSKDDEIYVSANRGDSWVRNTEGITGAVRTIFADNEHIYVGSYEGLFRLTDDEHWEKIDMGIASQSIGQIETLGSILLAAEQYTGIYKSADGGITWTNINSNIVLAMAVRNNEIYAAGLSGPLYHSADSGATWADIKANIPGRVATTINFTSKHVLVGAASNGLWLRPIGEVAPPYFYFPSTLSDSTFLQDEPIVIRVDQPMQTLDGDPISQSDLDDLIHVTTLEGTPANYTATLDETLLTITITISDVQDNTAYRITIAPVANPEGLETKAKSYVLRAISDAPPSVGKIVIEMPQNTTFTFAAGPFMAKYTDHEGSPLANIKVTVLPTHGALKVSGNAIALNTELSAVQLSTLTYTPATNFVGTDQWGYAASDGTSYSNPAFVVMTISPVTSVSEWLSSSMTFYPNPVDRTLIIKMANGQPVDQLTVIDMSGRRMPVPHEKNDETVMLDFAGVPAGMYLLHIRSGKQLYYQKVLRR
ncbi:MAG TPA: T9SS type A sorting domain-containing protein [Chryseolinea sp.]|nr:T9SS type A sorting domain-containing protein [Chryseolinea sp.]